MSSTLINPIDAKYSIQEKKDIELISKEISSGESHFYSAYEKLNRKINIDKFHEFKKTRKADMIEFINPNLSRDVLRFFSKAFNVDMYVNIKKACKSGKLPFYCFSKLGRDATDMQEDKKIGNTYTSKISDDDIGQLDKLISDKSIKVSGMTFNDLLDTFLPEKQKAKKKTEFQKVYDSLKSEKIRIEKNGFTVNQKLRLDSLVHAIQALLVVTKAEREGITSKKKKVPVNQS